MAVPSSYFQTFVEHELVLFMVEPDAIKTAMGGKGAEVRLGVCAREQTISRGVADCLSYEANTSLFLSLVDERFTTAVPSTTTR